MVKWAYILLGNDKTGKTTFQKEVIRQITNEETAKLNTNTYFDVINRIGTHNTRSVSVMNRSYQEKAGEYKTVPGFFANHFVDADACILSSHLEMGDIKQMIDELKKRFFNVCGVFFQNSIEKDRQRNEEAALLDWDERFYVENPPVENDSWEKCIRKGAIELTYHFMGRI